MAERYALFGTVAQEREINRAEDFAKQEAQEGDVLIYETDDREEAKAIYLAGGFERDGVWHAVTRVVDNNKQTIGIRHQAPPRKTDYDQQ